MEAFIKGIGIVSPQKTFNTHEFLTELKEYNTNSLRCVEPVYTEFLNPVLARRMGRTVKMGIAASSVCLKDSGVEMPDAIITGTALGCHEDTEKFLLAIIDNDEQFLTPTSFMQSTHNTVSSQIALQLKCMNYNFTYVHKGFSFESAVLDGLMTLEDSDAKNVLVGGHDEMTDRHFTITQRAGFWKQENVATMDIVNSKTPGSVSGEGAAFFMLSNEESDKNYAKLRAVKMIFNPGSEDEIENGITDLLYEKGLTTDDIDCVIYGISGDVRFDNSYYDIQKTLFNTNTAAYFKHLSGEYQTSSCFALWEAAMILKTQTIPKSILIGENKKKHIKNVLIYNNYMNTYHTVFLLSQC